MQHNTTHENVVMQTRYCVGDLPGDLACDESARRYHDNSDA